MNIRSFIGIWDAYGFESLSDVVFMEEVILNYAAKKIGYIDCAEQFIDFARRLRNLEEG